MEVKDCRIQSPSIPHGKLLLIFPLPNRPVERFAVNLNDDPLLGDENQTAGHKNSDVAGPHDDSHLIRALIRRSGLTVMNRGPYQHTGHRDFPIGRENMEIEPFPCFPLPLAVLFASPVTLLVQGFQDLSGTHLDRPRQSRKLFRVEGNLRRDLSLFLPPSFLGRSLHLRGMFLGPFPSPDGRAGKERHVQRAPPPDAFQSWLHGSVWPH